jgi:tetratricopeptide (TPR) repeat protein
VNSPLLNRLAAQNGGQHFNLDQADAGEIVRHMAGAALRFVEARDTAKGKAGAVDMYPRTAQPVRGRFTLAGKLKAGEAKVSLSYDQAGKSAPGSAYAVSVEDAAEGDLLRCFWAQKKLEELMIDQESNRREIIALGKDYGLVTPHTSLLVLERLEQYVEHRVRPPETLAKMRQEYEKAIDTIEMQKKQDKDKQVERILELWQARVAWWDKKFQYPKGFKYGTTQPTTEPTTREGPATEPAAPQVIQQMRDMETRLRGAAEARAQARAGLEAARAAFANAASDEAKKQARSKLADSLAEFLKAENEQRAAAAQMQALAELRSELVMRLSDVATSQPADRHEVSVSFGSVPARGSQFLGVAGQAEPGKDVAEQAGGAAILLKEWDPNAPYLKDLKPAEADERFSVYMKHRKAYGNSPAFFLDCADFFYDNKQPALGLQVLSNIAEMELENPQLLRVLAHRLAQLGELDLAIQVFEEVLKLRPEEPQSYRDLALVLARRAGRRAEVLSAARQEVAGELPLTAPASMPASAPSSRPATDPAGAAVLADYASALKLLNDVVMRKWDRFDEIELIALIEANAMLPLAKAAGLADDGIPLDKRLIKLLDCDIRIVLTWDADMTDMDLHVVEPSGERVYYEHNRSTIGGLVSKDFTDGYGPEEYLVHKAMNGMYKIEVNYYGSSAPRLLGAVTVQVEIITNFGRADEKRRSVTRRLTEKKQIIEVGQIEF